MERRRFFAVIGGVMGGGLGFRPAYAETRKPPSVDLVEIVSKSTPEERIDFVFDRDPTPQEVEDIKSFVWQEAILSGEDPQRWMDLAACESGFDPRAINRRSGAMGLVQFIPDTWNRAVQFYGDVELHPFNPVQNVRVGIFWKKMTNWSQWSCSSLNRARR